MTRIGIVAEKSTAESVLCMGSIVNVCERA